MMATLQLSAALMCLLSVTPVSGVCEVDLLFVLDASSSVRAGFVQMKQFILDLTTEILDIGEMRQRAALLEYSGHTKRWPQYDFGDRMTTEHFIETLKDLPYLRGTTRTGKALTTAQAMLAKRRLDVLTLVLVVTDGYTFDPVEEPAAAIHALPNVLTFAIGVQDKVRRFELDTIAGDPSRVLLGEDLVRKVVKTLKPYLDCDPVTTTTTTTTTTTPRPTRPPTRPPTQPPTPRSTRLTTTPQTTTTSPVPLSALTTPAPSSMITTASDSPPTLPSTQPGGPTTISKTQ